MVTRWSDPTALIAEILKAVKQYGGTEFLTTYFEAVPKKILQVKCMLSMIFNGSGNIRTELTPILVSSGPNPTKQLGEVAVNGNSLKHTWKQD